MTAAPSSGGDLGPAIADEVPALLRTARALTRDPHSAEDLVQETVARALERQDSFRGESSLRHWLRRILHNLAIDRARRDREVTVAEVEERWMDDAYTVDAVAVVERAETRAEIEDALVRLPFIYRTAVVLHDMEGLTVREVADMTGVDLPAAKQRLRRGRMMLVTALAEGHERRVALRGVPLRCWDARQRVSDYLEGDVDTATAPAARTPSRDLPHLSAAGRGAGRGAGPGRRDARSRQRRRPHGRRPTARQVRGLISALLRLQHSGSRCR